MNKYAIYTWLAVLGVHLTLNACRSVEEKQDINDRLSESVENDQTRRRNTAVPTEEGIAMDGTLQEDTAMTQNKHKEKQ